MSTTADPPRRVTLHWRAESALESLPADVRSRAERSLSAIGSLDSISKAMPLRTDDGNQLLVLRLDDGLRAVFALPETADGPILILSLFDKDAALQFAPSNDTGAAT
jgi:HEAT repeat protein